MTKSIIIGSNGYIGRNLAVYLRSVNETIICFDVQEKSSDPLAVYKQLDITSKESIAKLDLTVDYIYMFAGLTGTNQGFESFEKYIDINEKGLLNLLTRMKVTGSSAKIIFPSTRLVYKGKEGQLLAEDAEKEAKTIYALNKLSGEYLLEMYKNAFDIRYTVFRICVPYGSLIDGENSYGTIGFFLQNALNRKNITLYGDGSLRRTFTHVVDICAMINAASKQQETDGKIFNIGGEDLSLKEVAIKIASKHRVSVEFIEWPSLTYKIESGDTIFDARKLETIVKIGYQETFDNWLSKI